MRFFRCDYCGCLVFFENTHCLNCRHVLAYLPDQATIGALDPCGDGHWTRVSGDGRSAWRLCRNYRVENICNWAIRATDENPLCLSCQFTQVIPDQTVPGNKKAWCRLEAAKRRVLYTILELQLPLISKSADKQHGLAFEFRADPMPSDPPVLSGHLSGTITLNIAEADDAEREARRTALGEPYRTLIGHLRHEVGHYYWDRLVRGTRRLARFRALFGDERSDYSLALAENYRRGPAEGWQERFISAYASSHPWEDWAETWSHYLHMVDALTTAADAGLSLHPPREGMPTLPLDEPGQPLPFSQMTARWVALTYVLNSLNRGLGLPDGYPFVIPRPAIEKLRFIHEVVTSGACQDTPEPSPPNWRFRESEPVFQGASRDSLKGMS